MSHGIEEIYSVYRETLRCARKAHTCDACGETIQPRHRYYSVAAVFQGEVESAKRCLRCQEIHVHLRTLAPGDMWPDEALNCGTDYEDEWGDLPDDVARLAFLSQDEAQALGKDGAVEYEQRQGEPERLHGRNE